MPSAARPLSRAPMVTRYLLPLTMLPARPHRFGNQQIQQGRVVLASLRRGYSAGRNHFRRRNRAAVERTSAAASWLQPHATPGRRRSARILAMKSVLNDFARLPTRSTQGELAQSVPISREVAVAFMLSFAPPLCPTPADSAPPGVRDMPAERS